MSYTGNTYKKIEICVHGVKNSLINSSTVLLLSSKHMQIMIILKVEGVFLGKIFTFFRKRIAWFYDQSQKEGSFFTTARYMYWYDLCTFIFYKRELVKLNTDVIPIVILKLHFKRDQCLGIMDNHIWNPIKKLSGICKHYIWIYKHKVTR